MGIYKENRIISQDLFYKNGNFFMKRYRLSEREEKIEYYYNSGKIFMEGFIYKDKAAKEWKAYDEEGNILSKGKNEKVIADVQGIYQKNHLKTYKYNTEM